MDNLYSITTELRNLLEINDNIIDISTGEIKDKQYLKELEYAFLTQTESFGLWIKNQQALINAIKAEEQAFAERRKFLESRLARNEQFAASVLRDELNGKFETSKIKMSLRKSESIQIIDEGILKKKFMTKKITLTPNKTDIKAAIKAGEKVKGAILVENQNLQIK